MFGFPLLAMSEEGLSWLLKGPSSQAFKGHHRFPSQCPRVLESERAGTIISLPGTYTNSGIERLAAQHDRHHSRVIKLIFHCFLYEIFYLFN